MADSPKSVAAVSSTPPHAATSPTLVKLLQTRATTKRLLNILETHTAALEPQNATIHSVSRSSITLSFYGVTPAEPSASTSATSNGTSAKERKSQSHVGSSLPTQQYATIPFATPLPSDPQDPSVKFNEEIVSEMVSRIVTLSSIPGTAAAAAANASKGGGKKIVIKVTRYLGPDSFISHTSIAYYVILSSVILSWLLRTSIANLTGFTIYPDYPPPTALPGNAGEYVKFGLEHYYSFLGSRLFGTDFKFQMICVLHAWVSIGRLTAVLTMRGKLTTYKVDSWLTWLAWMITAIVEGRPCVDRFQDEVKRLWVEGMEEEKKKE